MNADGLLEQPTYSPASAGPHHAEACPAGRGRRGPAPVIEMVPYSRLLLRTAPRPPHCQARPPSPREPSSPVRSRVAWTRSASFVPCRMSYILDAMEEKPVSDARDLDAIADEVEAGRGPVALVRPGHRPVVLVSAEEWQRLDELESAESTAWWRRDAAERQDATGEDPHDGEDEPGIDEDEFRRRFAHLLRSPGAA